MTEEVSIRVNFANAIPLFPLDQVALLPQQVLPLHIFEERYRQMIDHALDGAGQIALAKFDGADWKQEYHGNPPLRPAVCIGQIVQHERLPDGRYNVLLQGVCRAKIKEEFPPTPDFQYRRAILEPIGLDNEPDDPAEHIRDWLADALTEGPLTRLAAADEMLKLVENQTFPAPVVLEIVSFAMVNDDQARYELLAEGSIERRATFLTHHLKELSDLIDKAVQQRPGDWPKGCSWN